MKCASDSTKGSEELSPAKVLCQRDLYCDSMASSSSFFPSSSSISSTSQWKYDVFLSFRGEDTRNTAVDFVNYALQRRGIYVFKDNEKLEGGKTIKPELLKAIEESRFAVVILSENYASSTWCLEELVKIIDCEKEKRMTVLPIFRLPKTPGCSIDKKGFHQVELQIETRGLEVEKIGFRVV